MTTYCLREHDCFFAQAISSPLRSTRPRLDGRGFLHTLSQACCILLANLLEDLSCKIDILGGDACLEQCFGNWLCKWRLCLIKQSMQRCHIKRIGFGQRFPHALCLGHWHHSGNGMETTASL